MIQVGETYRAVLDSLPTEASESFLAYIKECFDIDDDAPIEELLDSSTLTGNFAFGGLALKLENEEDIATMIMDNRCADLMESPTATSISLDVAMYLTTDESIAIMQQCVTDSGGNIYIADKELLDEFPTIREHIFQVDNA